MLHLKEIDKNYKEVLDTEGFTESILQYDPERHVFNHQVMFALIDSGIIKKLL